MSKCISQCLTGYAEYFNLKEWVQRLRYTFYQYSELCGFATGMICSEIFAERGNLLCQIVHRRRRRAYIQNRFLAPLQWPVRSIQCAIQRFNCFCGALRKQIASLVKVQQQSLEALQQRVVQFSGDARPFG